MTAKICRNYSDMQINMDISRAGATFRQCKGAGLNDRITQDTEWNSYSTRRQLYHFQNERRNRLYSWRQILQYRRSERISGFIRIPQIWRTCRFYFGKKSEKQTRKIIPNISLATVYRNLDELERLGKIKKVSLENFAERYDANVFEHAHLVCERCGRINDVEIADVTVSHNICGAKRYEITFYGICGECREKYNKEILKWKNGFAQCVDTFTKATKLPKFALCAVSVAKILNWRKNNIVNRLQIKNLRRCTLC